MNPREATEIFLKTHGISRMDGFLVAVSGGADSISLLHVFHALKLRVMALHCNFHLRGEESDGDERFVRDFCEQYRISLYVKHFNTLSYAGERKISVEMAARELRYKWFQEVRELAGMDYVVTAHHADDVAETVIINLCRGTGIRGLEGIQPVRGNLLRPFLACTKADILQYVTDNQLDYRTDSTNASTDIVRNKVRHQIIPVCKEINPAFLAVMGENCETLRATELFYRDAIEWWTKRVSEERGEETVFSISRISESPSPFGLLYEMLAPYGFNKTQIRNLYEGRDGLSGKRICADGYEVVKDRGYWRLFPMPCADVPMTEIKEAGEYRIDEATWQVEVVERGDGFVIPADSSVACMDADKALFPLEVRAWEQGDRFCPLGMGRRQKKVSDFFVDAKFSAVEKAGCRLLLSGGEVAWIAGRRLDERFKVTDATRRVLRVTVVPDNTK